jgi:hypothetical protein
MTPPVKMRRPFRATNDEGQKNAEIAECAENPPKCAASSVSSARSEFFRRSESSTPPMRLRITTGGATQTPPAAPELIETKSPKQNFRARLGAKFKSMLNWMRERLFSFLRQ